MAAPRVLELFSGTGSIRLGCERLGWRDVVSVDLSPRAVVSSEHERTDILTWDYSDYGPFDFIWASPVCKSWSVATARHRRLPGLEPRTPEAVLGELLVLKTLEIIAYFERLNPNLQWAIENPVGRLRSYGPMVALTLQPGVRRVTITQCAYGTRFKKRTDLWCRLPGFVGLHCDCEQHVVNHCNLTRSMKSSGALPPLLVDAVLNAVRA